MLAVKSEFLVESMQVVLRKHSAFARLKETEAFEPEAI